MEFKKLQEIALFRCDEELGEDSVIDEVVKDGINEGYRFVATTIDKQYTSQTFPHASVITLPTKLLEVIDVHSDGKTLDGLDYDVHNNNVKILNRDYKNGDIEIEYYELPEKLILDTDVPIVDENYHSAIATYGAYRVMLYKKKYEISDRMLSEFNFEVGGVTSEV